MLKQMRTLSRVVPRWLKDCLRKCLDPKYAENFRLQHTPRYQRTMTTLMGKPIQILDSTTFLGIYTDIVEGQIYYFPSRTERPYIIDGGANVGISVIYFKQLYPESHVVAFEPDDEAFSVLKANVLSMGLRDVTLIHAALSDDERVMPFYREGADSGRLARQGDPTTSYVSSVRLRSYLDRDVQLLKLNIEGSEGAVLKDCADLLDRVERIIVEYHGFTNENQNLHTLMNILGSAGYRLYLRLVSSPKQPFISVPVFGGMDLQLLFYATRQKPNYIFMC